MPIKALQGIPVEQSISLKNIRHWNKNNLFTTLAEGLSRLATYFVIDIQQHIVGQLWFLLGSLPCLSVVQLSKLENNTRMIYNSIAALLYSSQIATLRALVER